MIIRFRTVLPAALIAFVGCSEREPPAVTTSPTVDETSPPAAAPPASTEAGSTPLAIGERMYGNLCVTCHGPAGLGDGSLAPGLPVKPRSFFADEWSHVDFAQAAPDVESALERALRDGFPDAMMPAYGSSLSDEEIDGLVQYVFELRRRGREG